MPAFFRDQTSHLPHTHTHTYYTLKTRRKVIPHSLGNSYLPKHMRTEYNINPYISCVDSIFHLNAKPASNNLRDFNSPVTSRDSEASQQSFPRRSTNWPRDTRNEEPSQRVETHVETKSKIQPAYQQKQVSETDFIFLTELVNWSECSNKACAFVRDLSGWFKFKIAKRVILTSWVYSPKSRIYVCMFVYY